MATSGNSLAPDAKRGDVKSVQVTLSGTPNTVTTVAIPNDAMGFRLYPVTNIIRWNIDAAPGAQSVLPTNDQSGVASDLSDGGYAMNDQWENRLIETFRTGRVLQLLSSTASVVVYVEFF